MKLLMSGIACALYALVSGSAGAYAITLDALIKMRSITDVTIDATGKRVALTAAAVDSAGRAWNADIWVVDADGKNLRRVTSDPAWDETPRWSPDGSGRLAFTSAGGGAPQLFVLEAIGAEPKQVTEMETGVTAFAWSPDGSRIACIVAGGLSDAARARMDAGADVRIEDEPAPPATVHVVDVQSREVRALPPLHGAGVTTLDWSPDGTRFAVTVQDTPGTIGFFYGSDVYIVDATTGDATPLVKREGMDHRPLWSPDGRSIVFLSHDGVKDWIGSCFACVVPADGSTPPRKATGEFDERDYDAEYLWSADSRTVFLVAPRGVTRHLYAIDVKSGRTRAVTDGLAVHGQFSFSADGKRMAFTRSTPAEPIEVYVSPVQSFRPRAVTDFNRPLMDAASLRSERVTWKSFDGLEIEGLLTTPANATGPLPLVTLIHGGPSTPMTAGFSPQAGWPMADLTPAVYTEQGYAVFMPNFRGTCGYGREFLRANLADWGGGDYRDVMTGIDELIRRGVADADRLAIAGWSYGGTLTSHIITQTNRFKAAIVGAGVTDQLSQYGTTDIPPLIETYMQGTPWEAADTYRRCSSITFAHQVTTPTLLMYGELDARVPPSQGREFYRVLKRRGVTAELVIFPRSGHFIFEPALEMDFQRRILEWLNRYLG